MTNAKKLKLKIKFKKVALLYIRCLEYNGCVAFEFNDNIVKLVLSEAQPIIFLQEYFMILS